MKTWICEICGDAYLGEGKPTECPFCGARAAFIKNGKEAQPITETQAQLSEVSRKNLEETLRLELEAVAVYTCMAGKALSYEIMKMYKRLAKVELEHAIICSKLLKMQLPATPTELCADQDAENFQKTIEMENDATELYVEFAKTSEDKHVKILFTALGQVEADHITLIKNYI